MSLCLAEDHSSLKIVKRHYIVPNKELYQITEYKLLDDFQQQHQPKWISHSTGGTINDIIIILAFHTTSNKISGKKTVLRLQSVVIYTRLLKICFDKEGDFISFD